MNNTVCGGKRSGQKKPDPILPRLCGHLCRDKGRFFGFKTGYGDCLCMDDALSVDDCKISKKDMHLYEYKGEFYFTTKFLNVHDITRFKSDINVEFQIGTLFQYKYPSEYKPVLNYKPLKKAASEC